MKKTLVVFGSVILFFLALATLFRLMHWPGAAPFFIFGFFLLTVVFVPLFFIQRMRENNSGINITTSIIGMCTFFLLFIGILFKLMHWPGASILLIFGTLCFVFPLLITYVIQQFKEARAFSEFWKTVFLSVFAAVFLLFWALAPSRSLLSAFLKVEDATLATNKNLDQFNTFLLKEIQAKDTAGAGFGNCAETIHSQADEMNAFIEQIKKELVARTYSDAPAIQDHWQIGAKDNYDIPTHYLLFSGTGNELFNRLNNYRELLKKELSQAIENKTRLENLGDMGIDTSVREELREGYDMNWEEAMFDSQTVVGALAILSSLQNQVRNVEFRALSTLRMQLP